MVTFHITGCGAIVGLPCTCQALKNCEAIINAPEPDAVDGKFAPSYAVVRADFHDAVALLHHYASNATQRIDISTQSLPRVVRELAALMTEEQRLVLLKSIASDPLMPQRRTYDMGIAIASAAMGSLVDGRDLPIGGPNGREDGPGIATLPSTAGKIALAEQALAFLDEDLLCGDA